MQLCLLGPRFAAAIALTRLLTATGARGGRLAAGGGPLEKVLTLLKDLKADIIKDGEVEQQSFDKYACWCEKSTAKKAGVIAEAQADLRELGQSILKAKGEVAVLFAEVEELEGKIREGQEAQNQATAIRQKQNGAYLAETAEMKAAMSALEKAITVLVKGTGPGGAFLQQGARARALVRSVVEKIPKLTSFSPKQLSELSEFVTASGGAQAKYTPQSMSVQGILKDMYETFASDLESATEAEATQNRNFEALIAEIVGQINMHKEDIQKKRDQKAKLEVQLADETQLYDGTNAQMKADVEFFDETKAVCTTKSDDWKARGVAREQELEGVTRAIQMLSSDDARELFARAIKPGKETGASDTFDTGVDISYAAPSLVQLDAQPAEAQRAFEALRAHASRAGSVRLALLGAAAREAKAGHFDAVIKSIDEMIATLKEEDTADIAKRDECKNELFRANSTISQLSWDIKVNTAKIDKIAHSISELLAEQDKTREEISEVREHMVDIRDQRTAENGEFLQAKKDDQDAIALLNDTRKVLSSYYADHNVTLGPLQAGAKALALAQSSRGRQGPAFAVSEFDAPDIEFSGKSARVPQGKGIISVLTMVIEDLSEEIQNSMRAEKEAQLEFERMYEAAEELFQSLGAKQVQLEGMIARDGDSKSQEEASKLSNEALLQSQEAYRKGIEPDCHWIFGAFEERAQKRAVEMEGLVTAKDFLAGYKPGEEALVASRNRILRGAASA